MMHTVFLHAPSPVIPGTSPLSLISITLLSLEIVRLTLIRNSGCPNHSRTRASLVYFPWSISPTSPDSYAIMTALTRSGSTAGPCVNLPRQPMSKNSVQMTWTFPTSCQGFGGTFNTSCQHSDLSLRKPGGSCRQIVFFIGLFQHLEDLRLLDGILGGAGPVDDLTLIPPFTPPLRGRLTAVWFRRVDILKDMINLFGGIRFRYMHVRFAKGIQLLLNACAESLETLCFDPTDLRGEQLSPKGIPFLGNNFTAGSSFRDFGFSRNNSLRTLEIPAPSIIGPKHGFFAPNPDTLGSLRTTPSTITSLIFSEVIVAYRGHDDFSSVAFHPPDIYKEMTPADRAREASWHRGQFGVFCQMYEVRDFQLMLCADV